MTGVVGCACSGVADLRAGLGSDAELETDEVLVAGTGEEESDLAESGSGSFVAVVGGESVDFVREFPSLDRLEAETGEDEAAGASTAVVETEIGVVLFAAALLPAFDLGLDISLTVVMAWIQRSLCLVVGACNV